MAETPESAKKPKSKLSREAQRRKYKELMKEISEFTGHKTDARIRTAADEYRRSHERVQEIKRTMRLAWVEIEEHLPLVMGGVPAAYKDHHKQVVQKYAELIHSLAKMR